MSYGQGNITFVNNPGAGGGGGTVTGANNGISLAGTDVVLGGNPLTQNSFVDLAGFQLGLYDMIGGIWIDNDDGVTQKRAIHIGDTQGMTTGERILVVVDPDEGAGEISMYAQDANGNPGSLAFFISAGLYSMGDLDGAANGSAIVINDVIQEIQLATNSAGLTLDGANGKTQLSTNQCDLLMDDSLPATTLSSLHLGIRVRGFNNDILIGDLDNAGNNTKISVDDFSQVVGFEAVNGIRTNTPITHDPSNSPWLLGTAKASAVTLDTTQYIEVEIGGIPYKLCVAI